MLCINVRAVRIYTWAGKNERNLVFVTEYGRLVARFAQEVVGHDQRRY